MSSPSPTIYLLHGSDEFAIQSFLKDNLISKMGGADGVPDITTLDGRTDKLEQVKAEAQTIPFLSKRRLLIIEHPLALAKKDRVGFKELLGQVPETTALVLVAGELPNPKKGIHWLLDWAQNNSERCWTRAFTPPTGAGMTNWIQDQAKELGGEFERPAAQLLASYLDEDPRLARKEIEKLLFYVDHSRAVVEEDVIELVVDVRQGDVFEMVDAIGYGDGPKAMFMLRRLLEGSDPLPLFGMIVRQFRLLIQIRELVDQDPTRDHVSIAREIGSHPYPVQKIMPQTKLFTLEQLKAIFHQLSEVDLAIKTGQLEGGLALDILVASLTQ